MGVRVGQMAFMRTETRALFPRVRLKAQITGSTLFSLSRIEYPCHQTTKMTISRRSFFRQCSVAAFSGVAISVRKTSPPFDRGPFSPEANRTAGTIRLDNNENAYGPSKRSIQVIQGSLDLANRYPDSEYNQLLETIAKLHGITVEKVVLG